jgi:hypothetical protein
MDDLNNMGLRKVIIGEDDLFQIGLTDELYAHMNANYVRLNNLPDFDHYNDLLEAVARGDDFISTGEVLLPRSEIRNQGHDDLSVTAAVSSTFPLREAEIVWGDGKQTYHERIDLQTSHAFDQRTYEWKTKAPGWNWARVAVWDIAGNGGFTNPTWRRSAP